MTTSEAKIDEQDAAEPAQQRLAARGALADLEQRAVGQPDRRDFELARRRRRSGASPRSARR